MSNKKNLITKGQVKIKLGMELPKRPTKKVAIKSTKAKK